MSGVMVCTLLQHQGGGHGAGIYNIYFTHFRVAL